MPEMDGEKTMDLVRNQQGGFCRKTPIIALTANAMSGAEEKYRKMGFSDYLANRSRESFLRQCCSVICRKSALNI